ncbi:hypothetical protein CDAR_115421 [Caerostris darwini]|uniref:Uncharacterized protein n=1 Tax=Caerostris darwini TaxID=1538125 RepID=A0AAV4UA53_9ARAC|nr:hypothetical protein CDAR_115421 [Caerostris darwini]
MNHGGVDPPLVNDPPVSPGTHPCFSLGLPTDRRSALMSVSIEQPMQIVFKWLFNSVLPSSRIFVLALEGNRCRSPTIISSTLQPQTSAIV